MKTRNKNTKCANQKLKQNFILITCENMNMNMNMNQINLWCKIMLQTTIEQIAGNWIFIYIFWGSRSRRLWVNYN